MNNLIRHDRDCLGVLHVTNDFAANGTGITNLLRTLALAQVEAGFEVHIACRSRDERDIVPLEERGIIFHRLPRLAGPASVLRLCSRVRRIVEEHDLDVVHAHTVKATLPVVLGGRRLRSRSVATIHNSFQRSARLMLLVRRPVSVSNAVDREMTTVGGLRLPLRTTVVPNGVRRSEPVGPVPTDVSQRTALYVGGLHHRKGVDILLHAFARVLDTVPDANLVIAGRRDEPAVEQLAEELGLGRRVDFLGLLDDPATAMSHAAVVLVPSRHEPFGLVAAEARLVGAPVIASEVGGLPEVLDGGDAGQLLPVGDVAAWSAAIARMLSDPAHRDLWARRSARGADRLDERSMVRGYSDVYATLIPGPARHRPDRSAARPHSS